MTYRTKEPMTAEDAWFCLGCLDIDHKINRTPQFTMNTQGNKSLKAYTDGKIYRRNNPTGELDHIIFIP